MILVTGANGFVGTALCHQLVKYGENVRGAIRWLDRSRTITDGMEYTQVGDIGSSVDWSEALKGTGVVIHLAARVHVMRDEATDPLTEFRAVNVAGTLNLARQAVKAGVRRFIYLSSIKVSGEKTLSGRPFTEQDAPAPLDPYGISKHEAEEGLRMLSQQTGMEVVIIRPPLVYGPGVKGNFLSLLQFVDSGMPLPLGRCQNRRSLMGLANLVDLLTQCLTHPAAAGQTFLVSDGKDLSTPELLQCVAQALGKRARLLPLPTGWLRLVADLVGRASVYERLCGSLRVDISKVRRVLSWTPPQTVDAEIIRTVQWYRTHRRK